MDNPLYGKKLDEVVLDFKVKYAESAFMNGWDGLLAFYQPAEGAAIGRVSIQTAPYICYNEMEAEEINKWMDLNNPDALKAAGIEIPVTKLDRAETHHYYIRISADEVVMEVDGNPVEQVKNGSASVSYQDILDYISKCQKFSWGVVAGTNCFWGMEKCTLTDASVKGYYTKEYTDVEEDNKKVTVTLHYPDKTTETVILRKNHKLNKPVSEGEDETGKYTIDWYTDEAKTVLYDFEKAVSENLDLYGSKNYQPGGGDNKITVMFHYPDGTVETKTVEKNTRLEQPVFEGSDTNGKYGIIWYTDEAKTLLYDFDTDVSEDLSLYGSYYYYCEEPGEGDEGSTRPVKTGIWVERIEDQAYTGAAMKPAITVYDGTKKLTEKVDYKVSYSDNKKVSTPEKPAKVTITPCGNYEKASKFFIHFNIVQRKLTKDNVTIKYKPEMNVRRNSKGDPLGQTQKITLKYGKLTVPAKDYTVTYKKGEETVEKLTEAGVYQLIIKTKDTSSFDGELNYDVVVTDKILTSALKFKVAAQNYTGSPLTPDIAVTYKGKSVVPADKKLSDIFDIEYRDNTSAGTATVILTAKADSDYCGSKTLNFKINGTAIKKAAMEGFQSSIPYTGEAVTQNISLKLNKGTADERILEAKDYDIAYTANINAGKVTMTITGKGEFSGTVKKNFTISKINLAQQTGGDVTIQFAETDAQLKAAQDKSGAKPAVKVTWKDKVLEQDKDYTVTYSGNKAAGVNAKVTVKGIGNYTGVRKNALTFEIIPKEISDASITIAAEDLKYTANGNYKAKLKVYDNGVKLSAGEYTVGAVENITLEKDEAGNDTHCGTATVQLTGKKNYTGTAAVTIRIKKVLISSAKVTVNGTYYYANGKPVCPAKDKLTVTIGSGNNKVTLSQDEFVIEGYSNNTRKGNATLTIRGEGTYGGTKSVKFKILPKWMKRSN